jgi:hypothetical protein
MIVISGSKPLGQGRKTFECLRCGFTDPPAVRTAGIVDVPSKVATKQFGQT